LTLSKNQNTSRMDSFYFMFNAGECLGTFMNGGFTYGFIILIFSSIITTAFFYLVLGNIAMRHATYRKWIVFLILNMFLVFLFSMIILSNSVFGIVGGLSAIPNCVWFFSILNGTIYGTIFYFIFSLLINNFSQHSRFIPFKIFK